MRRRGYPPTRRAELGPTRFLLACRLSSYRPGPRLALTFRGPGSRARSPSARRASRQRVGRAPRPIVADDSPGRLLERLVLDLQHDLRYPFAHRGVDVRVLVLAGYLVPQTVDRVVRRRLLPSRLALERGHVAPIAPRKVCSDSASSSVAGAEPRWHRPSPPAGMVREECRSSSAVPQPRLLFPVDADAGCRAASLAPRAPRLALRCAATGG